MPLRRVGLQLVVAAMLAGCETPPAATPATQSANIIVVRDFRIVSSTRVAVDTSFGFSLNRGQPGVPLSQRAIGLAGAAAFNVADALTERLRQLGYNAVHATARTPDPAGKAVIVVGTLREVDEGHRRAVGNERAKVAADAEIDEWGPGIRPALALHLDFGQLAGDGIANSGGKSAAALGAAARRLGRELARSVVEIAARSGIARTLR